ncbi:VWA domain-containing protein [Methylibium sp.]|uniref:VWA domain-containing protein n=1 Tax=Methylibium sp. TaxID=2067992 RepID=UPI003D0F06D2
MAGKPEPIERIAGFAAMLREHGLTVGVPEQQAMVRAALAWPVTEYARLNGAWRAIACHDVRDWRRWPDLFQRYWWPEAIKGSTRVSGRTRPGRTLEQVVRDMQQQIESNGAGDRRPESLDTSVEGATVAEQDSPVQRAQGGASRTEALHDRSFSQWLPQDLALLDRLAEQIAKAMRRRLTRRWRRVPTGHRLDLRSTLRRCLATGGVPIRPAWRVQRRERQRLFILVDVSRSMETHAQLFLRIARAFVGAMNARVFVFHTRLAEVTALLRSDSAAIQEKVNAVTAGFGGGTRIATSLADFRTSHARGQLGRGSRAWVLSDGYDADEPDRLSEELEGLCRLGTRVTWFHPSSERPVSQAMTLALSEPGRVERLHRLDSLRDLSRLANELH